MNSPVSVTLLAVERAEISVAWSYELYVLRGWHVQIANTTVAGDTHRSYRVDIPVVVRRPRRGNTPYARDASF